MEVYAARGKKYELELEIRKKLQEFTEETEIPIKGITLEKCITQGSYMPNYNVKIEVDL